MTAKLLLPSRILIVDDHSMVREGLRLRIEAFPDLEVCGEATTEDEAMELVKETSPQLIIVDISLKVVMGLNSSNESKRAIRRLRCLFPRVFKSRFTQNEHFALVL